jgi:putative DNA primase/helicase
MYGIERLEAAFADKQQTSDGNGPRVEDFFGEGLDVEALIAAARTPGTRHISKLRLVAHWTMRGYSDAEIILMGEAIGHDSEQTRTKFAKMIADARVKWNTPNQKHTVQSEPEPPQNAAAVEPEKIAWHWYPYLPGGQVSLVAGYGGCGKGLACMDLTARLTTGTSWPLSEQLPQPADVLWCEAEDPRASVLVPRLIAANGARERVHFCNPRELAVLNLRGFIQRHSIGLIVLSPLVSFLNGLKDVIGELGVRKTLEMLQEAIEGTRCAVLGITHLNKKNDLAAVDRVLGSVAFVNFTRSVLLVARDKYAEDEAVRFMHCKHNLSVKGPDLLFRKRHVGSDRTDQFVRVEWEETDGNLDLDGVFDRRRAADDETTASTRAWLVAYLERYGETPSSVVIAAAEKEGFSAAAIEKARKREPRCKTRKGGFALGWLWYVL